MSQDHVSINRDIWNADAGNWVEGGEWLWSLKDPVWGIYNLPEAEHALLPRDMTGMDAVELGCGTGYVSAWMHRRGATVTALDVSTEQLATVRRLAEAQGAQITFLEANAEATGLPDAAFDFAISEYGAAIWCRPEVWLREAWRLLRPGGRLVFLGNHPILNICQPMNGAPAEFSLHRPYRGMWGADWTEVEIDPSGVCFNLTISGWMDLFRKIGITVDRFQELYAPASQTEMRAWIPAEWAKDYPAEHVWHLIKP